MTTYKDEVRQVTDKTYCDKCGEESCGEARLFLDAGYSSPRDGQYWNIDLCENCFWETFQFVTGREPTEKDQYCMWDSMKEI